MNPPTPEQIFTLRTEASLTQAQAAELVHSAVMSWRQWEKPADDPNHRDMHPSKWELFTLKVDALMKQRQAAPKVSRPT